MKKITWILALFAVFAMMLTACGGDLEVKDYYVTFDKTNEEAEWPVAFINPIKTKSGVIGNSRMPQPPVHNDYIFAGWEKSNHSVFTGKTKVTSDITVYATWTDARPSFSGSAVITSDGVGDEKFRIGKVLGVDTENLESVPSPAIEFHWLADGEDIEVGGTFTITGAVAGKEITCMLVHPNYQPLFATGGGTVPYEIDVVIDPDGKDDEDSVTASPLFGHAGAVITLSYTIATIDINNQLVLSGVAGIPNTPITSGSNIKYTIAAGDANDGYITINAAFAHSDKLIETIAFPNNNAAVHKIYGDDNFSQDITSTSHGTDRLVSFTNDNVDVASVHPSTGVVTIKKAGHTTITATKMASDTHAESVAHYTLYVAQRQLGITGTEVVKSKPYDGYRTAAVTTVGTLTHIVGSDTVTVDADARYANADAGSGKQITVTFSIDGADAENYLAPESITYHDGVITATVRDFLNIVPNGDTNTKTTTLTLTFDQPIPELGPGDINLSGVENVNKGDLGGTAPVYTLGISGDFASGTLTVTIAKVGFVIHPASMQVEIFGTVVPPVYTPPVNCEYCAKAVGSGCQCTVVFSLYNDAHIQGLDVGTNTTAAIYNDVAQLQDSGGTHEIVANGTKKGIKITGTANHNGIDLVTSILQKGDVLVANIELVSFTTTSNLQIVFNGDPGGWVQIEQLWAPATGMHKLQSPVLEPAHITKSSVRLQPNNISAIVFIVYEFKVIRPAASSAQVLFKLTTNTHIQGLSVGATAANAIFDNVNGLQAAGGTWEIVANDTFKALKLSSEASWNGLDFQNSGFNFQPNDNIKITFDVESITSGGQLYLNAGGDPWQPIGANPGFSTGQTDQVLDRTLNSTQIGQITADSTGAARLKGNNAHPFTIIIKEIEITRQVTE